MDDYKISDNFQRTEGYKMISPHHFHPTKGVGPSDSIAHGNKWGQIIMPTESHVYGETWTDTDTVVALVKQNGYKIAKAYMMQCYSAYKGVTPKPDVRRVDFGAMWRSVSVRFFGYVGENVLLLDVVPSRRRRRRGGRRR